MRYLRSVGLGLFALGVWSSSARAQAPDLPFALVGERAALQDAICAQNWELAVQVTDRLLALEALPASYRSDMITFREGLLQYQEAEVVLPAVPGCENLSDPSEELAAAGDALSARITSIAGSMMSPITQDIVREMEGNNLLMVQGLCSLLQREELENPLGLMVAAVENNFFGLPILEVDELDDFQEGDREQQQAMVEYLSFLAFVGATQFCPENVPVVEALFGVEIPDTPPATPTDVER